MGIVNPFKIVRESFRTRIFFFLTFLVLVISVVFTTLYLRSESASQTERLVAEGELLARLLAYNSRIGVFAEQESMLKEAVVAVLQHEHALSAAIFAVDGKLLCNRAKSGSGRLAGPPEGALATAEFREGKKRCFHLERSDCIEFFAPVMAGTVSRSPESLYLNGFPGEHADRSTGMVRVVLDKKELNAKLHKLLETALLLATIFLLLGLATAYLVAKSVTRPLNSLMEGVKTLEQGDLSGRIPVETEDELGKVSLSFNAMAEALERREGENRELAEQLRLAQKQEADEALRNSEEEFRALFETSRDAIVILDREGFLDCNKATLDMFGCASKEQLLAKHPADLSPPRQLDGRDSFAAVQARLDAAYLEGYQFFEWQHRRLDGTPFPAEVMLSRFELHGKTVLQAVVRDVTERKRLKEQLFHSQKMEAIGQLAGGVAHDFNNILTAIIGFANLVEMRMAKDDLAMQYLEQILVAADRAAQLTQGLLAFSRKQVIKAEPIDLNSIVANVEKLLKRLISEEIELKIALAAHDLVVMADSGQIDQILMNLATNARDAMPDGGALTIETGSFEMTRDYIKTYGFGSVGQYAMIAISDNGTGMDEATRARIFEPFFTTKEVGKGTGLGLAIVYGIVKQHDGFISVASEPGKGTAFKIYLPLVQEEKASLHLAEDPQRVMGGAETVLIVEDNPEVRNLTRTLLETYGYRVIEAVDGQDALVKFGEHRADVKLVIMDVVMPKMNGREAFAEISGLQPGVKVLFTSAYTPDVVQNKGVSMESPNFIPKPSSPQALLGKVRELLSG